MIMNHSKRKVAVRDLDFFALLNKAGLGRSDGKCNLLIRSLGNAILVTLGAFNMLLASFNVIRI